MEEVKRQMVADKLHAGMAVPDICRQLGVSRRLVFKVKALMRDGKSLAPLPKGGSSKSVRTPEAIAAVSAAIAENPRINMRQLARDHQMPWTTMYRLVHEDLALHSRVVQQRPLLTDGVKERRLERAAMLLNRLKHEDKGKVRIFSDEKIFTADAAVNRRNSRYLTGLPVAAVDPNIRITPYAKAPLKQMVLGVMASDGQKCPPVFVAAGERINAVIYQDLLRQHVVPWLKTTYPEGNYVFQQDSAPAHAARSTQEFLRENMASHWSPELWPPFSPDLNPLDFSIWGVLEARVQATAHANLASLRASIAREWTALDENYVQSTCRSFRRRLEQVIAAGGGYIE
jgi:DDE superfamily endonuclease/Transposase